MCRYCQITTMNNIIKKMRTATIRWGVAHLSYYNTFLVNCVNTIWCRFKMSVWGVKYGSGVKFRGNTFFSLGQTSRIVIGDKCVFNSKNSANFRGINHICILQASEGGTISIGNRCGFSGVSIVSSISVTLGDDVMCGTNVMIGDRNDHEDQYPEWQPSPVRIGDNVWIGMNSIVMRGVTIGDNVIIGAGSVVTKDIPPNCVAAGVPCKIIKNRTT